MKFLSVIILFFIRIQVYANWCDHPDLCLQAVTQGVDASMEEVKKINLGQKSKCGEHIFNERINYNLQCPIHLTSQLEENKSGSWFNVIKSPNESCLSVDINAQEFSTLNELENFLQNDDKFANFAPVGIISKCLSRYSKYSFLEKKVFLTKYYSHMKRFESAQIETIESIAQIDSLLGNDISVSCSSKYLDRVQHRCEYFQQNCKGKGGVEELAKDAMEYLPIYQDLLKQKQKALNLPEKKCIKKSSRGCKKYIENSERKELINSVSLGLSSVEDMFPWFKGNKVKGLLGEDNITENDLLKGFKNQLIEDKKNIVKNLRMFQGATSCLNSTFPVEGCDDYYSALSKTTPVRNYKLNEMESQKLSATEQRKRILINSHLSQNSCIDKIRGIKENVNSELLSTGVQIGLTLATFGASSLGLLGKVATMGKLSKGKLLLKSSFLSSAVIGEAYLINSDLKSAIDACDSHLEEDSNKRIESHQMKCPKNPKSTSMSDWKSCVLSSSLMGLNLLPVLGPLAGKKLSSIVRQQKLFSQNSSRLKKAENLLNRKLSNQEKESLLKSHNVGAGELGEDGTAAMIGNYTHAQKVNKASLLMKNGFTKEEARILLDEGVAGMVKGSDEANVSEFIGRLLNSEQTSDNFRKMAMKAKEKGLENFLVVDGNLVLKNSPNSIMIRGNGPQVVSNVSVKASRASSFDLESWRRSLSMTKDEAKLFDAIDTKNISWVRNRRFKNKTLCSKTTKSIKTFRREKTSMALSKLKNPSSFHYHGKVPNEAVLDRHINNSGASAYMGLATSMDSKVVGGNGGKFISPICINPGTLVCIVGGAESELVVMGSSWSTCR